MDTRLCRRVDSVQGDAATAEPTTDGRSVAIGVVDYVHMRQGAHGHFTPDEARAFAAAIVDVADSIDRLDTD